MLVKRNYALYLYGIIDDYTTANSAPESLPTDGSTGQGPQRVEGPGSDAGPSFERLCEYGRWMTMRRSRADHLRLYVGLVVCVVFAVSCSTADTGSTSTQAPPTTVGRDEIDDRYDLLPEAGRRTGRPARTPAYWAVWNTCAPNNRAAEAAANGGRAAGWVLVDDILADPGCRSGSTAGHL